MTGWSIGEVLTPVSDVYSTAVVIQIFSNTSSGFIERSLLKCSIAPIFSAKQSWDVFRLNSAEILAKIFLNASL